MTNKSTNKFLCFSFRFPLYEFFVDEGNANNEHKVTLNKKQTDEQKKEPKKQGGLKSTLKNAQEGFYEAVPSSSQCN